MVCRECGCEQAPGHFCRQCGTKVETPATPFAAEAATAGWQQHRSSPASSPTTSSPQRVQHHLQILGVLWCAYGSVRILTGLLALTALHTFAATSGRFPGTIPNYVPLLVRNLAPVVASAIAAFGILDLVTGWALLTRQSWARVLAIVIAIRSLIKPPFGTALGIYTLWVLAPRVSAAEWNTMQAPSQVNPA